MRKYFRSSIELFLESPCCFYREQRPNIKRHTGFLSDITAPIETYENVVSGCLKIVR